MSWIVIALIAYFLYAVVFVLDKFILARPIKSPLVYAFYPGVLGILAVLVVPFVDFSILSPSGIVYALLSGALFIWGLIYFYKTLQAGEASRAVPFTGALTPVATFVFSYLLGVEKLSGQQAAAFLLLVIGSFLIAWGYKNHDFLTKHNIGYGIAAALFFGLSLAFTKLVFEQTNFLNGFIWMRFGGFIFSLLLLTKRSWRNAVFSTTGSVTLRGVILFFSDKIIGSAALVLQNYAISLGSVIIVNALQSTQYLFLFILASLLSIKIKFRKVLHETVGKGAIIQKVLAILVIGFGLWLLIKPHVPPQPMTFGITFSPKFAQELGLDWREAYLKILDELKVKNVRLVAYWDVIEPEKGKYVFDDVDWQIQEAEKRGAKVLFVVGRKTPRWPECHKPPWAYDLKGKEEKQEVLKMLAGTISHFKNFNNIYAWQVENEPLFPFGKCKSLGLRFLQKEVDLVRSLDSRPIVLTDSGELGFAWPVLISRADIFGTTLYRYIHNNTFGYIKYWWIPTEYFRFKVWFATKVFGKEILISELQAEPWEPVSLVNAPFENQYKTMNVEKFREVVDYARRSGFTKAYFWGAEWWLWLKEKHGQQDMWNEAKAIISPHN
ncbi:MAG: DMT family transporter [Candidatus Sungiibacteriota bacterium]|uniref:DMT family transporter n=1 Tax=Candidatus Sungiibacteriota bacterium TaxID=2750080 RepID=A0A7T5RJ19_9BACT|nr:MAG: DMT family transporter [Candidatus Sungbacteria bacterium]